MKYVPAYLLPKGVAAANSTIVDPEARREGKFDGAIASGVVGKEMDGARGFIPFNKRGQGKGRGRGRGGFGSKGRGGGSKHGTKRKSDPLRKFGA
jgi:hypothetical protein